MCPVEMVMLAVLLPLRLAAVVAAMAKDCSNISRGCSSGWCLPHRTLQHSRPIWLTLQWRASLCRQWLLTTCASASAACLHYQPNIEANIFAMHFFLSLSHFDWTALNWLLVWPFSPKWSAQKERKANCAAAQSNWRLPLCVIYRKSIDLWLIDLPFGCTGYAIGLNPKPTTTTTTKTKTTEHYNY